MGVHGQGADFFPAIFKKLPSRSPHGFPDPGHSTTTGDGHSVTFDGDRVPAHPVTAGRKPPRTATRSNSAKPHTAHTTAQAPATPPGQLIAGLAAPPTRANLGEHFVAESPPGALTPTTLAYPPPADGSATTAQTSLHPRSLLITNQTFPPDLRPARAQAGATSVGTLAPLPTRTDWFDVETAVVSQLSGSPAAIAAGAAALTAHAAAAAAQTAGLVGIGVRINIALGWKRYG